MTTKPATIKPSTIKPSTPANNAIATDKATDKAKAKAAALLRQLNIYCF